jgi:hypothetical protein
MRARPRDAARTTQPRRDNWRVLFAIAEDLGHGEEARVTTVALSAHRHDEDFGVALLSTSAECSIP